MFNKDSESLRTGMLKEGQVLLPRIRTSHTSRTAAGTCACLLPLVLLALLALFAHPSPLPCRRNAASSCRMAGTLGAKRSAHGLLVVVPALLIPW